jgi:hypothetical protein
VHGGAFLASAFETVQSLMILLQLLSVGGFHSEVERLQSIPNVT